MPGKPRTRRTPTPHPPLPPDPTVETPPPDHPVVMHKMPRETTGLPFETFNSLDEIDALIGKDEPGNRESPIIATMLKGLDFEAIRAEKASRKLRLFIEFVWPIIEPGTEFKPGWHIDCKCEHLEAVTRGEIKNLIINEPPRHMKSIVVSVIWPVWTWINWPASRWLCASYAEGLSINAALRSRRIIQSALFQRWWGDRFKLSGDQNLKSRYDNNKGGARIATSVGGSVTGEGGDFLVADDPHNVYTAESDAIREDILSWYSQVWVTRRNDPRTSRSVIIMQRVHQHDITGYLLEQNAGYHHLVLPGEYESRTVFAKGEPRPHKGCPIYEDPRTESGELLWPEQFGAEEIKIQKAELGPYGFSGQVQQTPTPREGVLFKAAQIRALPIDFDTPQGNDKRSKRERLRMMQAWDLAYSERDRADYTVALTGGVDAEGNLYLLDLWRQRIGEQQQESEMAAVINKSGAKLVAIEEAAYRQTATRDLVRRLQRVVKGARVVPVKVTSDKYMRAQLPAGRMGVGMVFADKTALWYDEFVNELTRFPLGAHDDQVDCLSLLTHLAVAQPVVGERAEPQRWEWRQAAPKREQWDPFAEVKQKREPKVEKIRG